MMSAAKRIAELREQIRFHDRKYYEDSRPVISDRDYDRLMQELIDLEKENPDLITSDSPTQRVGGDVQTELKPVRHAVPMMSIDNTYSEAEIRAFDERVRRLLGGDGPGRVHHQWHRTGPRAIGCAGRDREAKLMSSRPPITMRRGATLRTIERCGPR